LNALSRELFVRLFFDRTYRFIIICNVIYYYVELFETINIVPIRCNNVKDYEKKEFVPSDNFIFSSVTHTNRMCS